MDKSTKRDIQKIVTLLTSAVTMAFIVAGLFLYHYSPTGLYIAGQTILDPQVMDQINIKSEQGKKGQGRFLFEKTDFSYFDVNLKSMRQIPISFETYKRFYNQIETEKSIEKVDESIKRLFNNLRLATISTTMRANNETHSKRFQVIQFTPEDYYRVQLHGDQDPDEWAYFFRPAIYKDIMHLFTGSSI